MTFEEYEKFLLDNLIIFHPKNENYNLAYFALGLGGESGEYVERFKKFLRNGPDAVMDDKVKKELLLELGDVLFYVVSNVHLLGFSIEDLMQTHIDKLNKRIEKNTVYATESRKDE